MPFAARCLLFAAPLKAIDLDGDGEVDETEFLKAMSRIMYADLPQVELVNKP